MLFSECSILSQEFGFTVTACFFLSFCLGVYEQLPEQQGTVKGRTMLLQIDASHPSIFADVVLPCV